MKEGGVWRPAWTLAQMTGWQPWLPAAWTSSGLDAENSHVELNSALRLTVWDPHLLIAVPYPLK